MTATPSYTANAKAIQSAQQKAQQNLELFTKLTLALKALEAKKGKSYA